jgi:hypothetical protein
MMAIVPQKYYHRLKTKEEGTAVCTLFFCVSVMP